MLQVTTDSQVTEVSYHTVESNFTWVIKNPAELSDTIRSKKVQIPSVDVEWDLIIEAGKLKFHMNVINDERNEFLKQPNSKHDQYRFEYSHNGVQAGTKGYSELFEAVFDEYKVAFTTSLIPNTGYTRAITYTTDQPSVYNNCKLWTIEAKVTIRTSRKLLPKLTTAENKLKTLSVDFEALSDGIHSDFTIIVKSKEFKVHKSILSKYNSELMKKISSNMKEDVVNKVEINDVEPSTFEKFLVFIYCGKIPEDMIYYAIDLFVLADKYEVEDLKIICEKHISENITKDNAMAVFKLANIHSSKYDLKRMSLQIIKEKLQESFDTETLEKLLENEVFEAMII